MSLMWLPSKKTEALSTAINNMVKPMKYWIVIAQDSEGAYYNFSNIDDIDKVTELCRAILDAK